MPESTTTIGLPIEEVFDLLTSPSSYPAWLVGCRRIRAVDHDWPRPGSAFHHVVGVGPLRVADSTVIEEADPPHRLVLDVRARPFGRGQVTFTLRAQGPETTEVSLDEEPTSPVLGHLRTLLSPPTRARNDESLSALRAFADDRRSAPSRFPFAFSGLVGIVARALGAGPHRAHVDLSGGDLRVRFGFLLLVTPLANVAEGIVTGPYRWWRVVGPLRVSLADRGASVASTASGGVCLRVHEAVPFSRRVGRLRTPAVTVTVADPVGLLQALDRDGSSA